MKNHTKLRASKLAIGLAIAIAAAPSMAQNTSSGIGGRIVTADGAPVAGATITITHMESGTSRTVTTSADGRYTVRGLRVGGPYTVEVTGQGDTERQEGLFLPLADVLTFNAELGEQATTLETVEVIADPNASLLFDSTAMGASTTITKEQLEGFASIQRNLQDYARLDPRLSQTDKERGEISAGGQNVRFNSITIDGVTTNDTFGLEANNLPTAKQPISIDAIEEVQVNIANFDVTQKGYTGANINAVTKSGTNEFRGSVYYVYRDEKAVGDRYNRTNNSYFEVAPFDESTVGMTFGGPLIKDRLFFFVSYEELESSRSAPAFGPLGSAQTNVAITPSSIAGAQNVARTNWGLDIGSLGAEATQLAVKDALIKIDANLTDTQRLSFRYNKTEQDEPIFPNYFNNLLSLSSQWYNQQKVFETSVAQLFSDWTDNFSTEINVSYRDYFSEPLNNARMPQIRLNFQGALPAGSPAVSSTSAGLIFGTERSRHFNQLGTETWNGHVAGTLILDSHDIKFGVDYADNTVFNAFLQDTLGNYTFGCINSSASVVYTIGAVNCSTSSRAVIEAAVLENFQRGRPTSYQTQVGAPGFTINDGVANWDYRDVGLFLQDTWAVNYNLTINAGFRVDRKFMGVDPIFNAAAAQASVPGSVVGNVVTRATGGFGIRNDVTIDGDVLFQPRLGFNYTFDSDRPMQLRGGLGLFEGAAANVWLSNPYSNNGIATRITGCGFTGVSACPSGVAFFNPNPDTQVVDPDGAGPLSFGTPTANVDFLSSNLSQPSVWKASLAFDHELPNGMVLSAEYVRTQVKDGIYFRHLNLGAPTRQGADGRDLFWTPTGYTTDCWNNFGNTVNPLPGACTGLRSRALSNALYNNVTIAENTDKGSGNNYSLSLSGSFLDDFRWSLGYSYTEATEVSSLSSSVANSNWQSVAVLNANEEVEANSAYLVKDRFIGQLTWSRAFFGDYRTSVGVVYEGRSGKPYSWIYNNDLNGDGATNDLLYIPTAFGSGQVVFRDLNGNGATDEEQTFWNIVNANGLGRYAGGVVERNSSFAGWTNNFDVRVSQEFPGFFDKHKAVVTLDILNFGNLLNKEWGRIDEIAFQAQGGLARSFVNYLGVDSQGRYVYGVNGEVEDFVTRQARGESQWAAQLTVKYQF